MLVHLQWRLEGNWYPNEHALMAMPKINSRRSVKAEVVIEDRAHSENSWIYVYQDGQPVGSCNTTFFHTHFFRRKIPLYKQLAKLVDEAHSNRLNAKYADGTILYHKGLERALVVEGQLKSFKGALVWKVRILYDEYDDRSYRADAGYLKNWRPLKPTDKLRED